ncbi:MAG: hypothetical protein WKG07_47200 [Hymenobacter sp.]
MGESWVFERTNLLPYDDGLTLHVRLGGSTGGCTGCNGGPKRRRPLSKISPPS